MDGSTRQEETLSKSQVYVTLAQNDVPPALAAEVSGIASDPEAFGDQVLAWRDAQAEYAASHAASDTQGGDGAPDATGEGDATPRKKQTQGE